MLTTFQQKITERTSFISPFSNLLKGTKCPIPTSEPCSAVEKISVIHYNTNSHHLINCRFPVFTPKLTAQVTITQIEPTSIDAVRVYYDLKNTGNVTIDYYEIYFIAQCTDNSTITDWTNGLNVLPGTTVSDYTFFDTGNKTVSSMAVYKIYLKNYQYDLELYINP